MTFVEASNFSMGISRTAKTAGNSLQTRSKEVHKVSTLEMVFEVRRSPVEPEIPPVTPETRTVCSSGRPVDGAGFDAQATSMARDAITTRRIDPPGMYFYSCSTVLAWRKTAWMNGVFSD